MSKFPFIITIALLFMFSGCSVSKPRSDGAIYVRNGESVAQQFKSANATYVINKTIDLKGKQVHVPEKCTLLFERGEIKNGTIVFNETRLGGNVRIRCSIKGKVDNDTINTDWFVDGAKKIRMLFDSSELIQAVLNLGASKVYFGKGYYQFHNIQLSPNVVIEGNNTILCPVVLEQNEYKFNFLKNVFYAADADEIIIKGLTFESKKTGTILLSFKSTSIYGEPLILVDKAKKVVIDGCVFRDIENCTYCNKAYNYYGKKQGSCVCLWDVNDASFINCEQVGIRHDEQVWIIPVNKPIMETKVTYAGNYVHDMTPGPNSSAFNCVAGTCLIEKNKVERYNYPGSMFNTLGKKLTIRNNKISDSYCSSVFDACEYRYFHNDEIVVEDNQVEAVNAVLLLAQSEKVTIRNNKFKGVGLYYSANSRVAHNSAGKYKYWYTDAGEILPVDAETVIENNQADFTLYDGNRSIAGTKADYGTGEILEPQKYNKVGNNYGCGILIHPIDAKAGKISIINNTFTSLQSLDGQTDLNNLAGTYPYTIKLINTESVVIRGNTINGCYPVYDSPNDYTCIGVYNYPDVMESLDKPSSISRKPSEYGKYLIEDNVFNVGTYNTFYPVAFFPRVNAARKTQLTIGELVVRNNKLGGVTTKVVGSSGLPGRSAYKQSGPVRVLKETLK